MPDDLLMCPVCLETVEDPHVLPQCGHTFCKRCIDGVAQGGSTLRCPTCRQPNQAAQARPNFALRQLLADGATGTSAGSSSSAPARSTANDQRATTEGDVHRRVDAGNRDQEHALVSLGVPPSLAELLCDEDKQIGLRIFLLDNSGSTAMGDGKYFYTDERDGRTYSAGCTRWEEISRMAVEQAEWNAAIQVPTEFCLLNARGDDNIPCRIDPKKGDVGRQIEGLRLLLKRNGPTGVTPLATRITAIAERLRQQEQQLISAGQKVVLNIATDGLPTSASSGHSTSATRDQLSRLLRQIQLELPIYLVIRLTTDDDSTIEYYNSIDSEIEVNMEVLDDIEAEAQEIQQVSYVHPSKQQGSASCCALAVVYPLLSYVGFRPVMVGWCTHHLSTRFARPERSQNCLTYSMKGDS
eukprot:COSAG02_NODE_2789_length_8024_cov_8.486183_3_plen_411_part_00